MFVKSTVEYLDTSTFSEKTRCNFGVAMATIRWLLSLCYSNNRNRYSKTVLYVKVEDTCSQVLWQKGSSRKDDWERRTSIRSGPFSFLGSGFAQIFKTWASRLLRVRTPSNTNSSNFYQGVYFYSL